MARARGWRISGPPIKGPASLENAAGRVRAHAASAMAPASSSCSARGPQPRNSVRRLTPSTRRASSALSPSLVMRSRARATMSGVHLHGGPSYLPRPWPPRARRACAPGSGRARIGRWRRACAAPAGRCSPGVEAVLDGARSARPRASSSASSSMRCAQAAADAIELEGGEGVARLERGERPGQLGPIVRGTPEAFSTKMSAVATPSSAGRVDLRSSFWSLVLTPRVEHRSWPCRCSPLLALRLAAPLQARVGTDVRRGDFRRVDNGTELLRSTVPCASRRRRIGPGTGHGKPATGVLSGREAPRGSEGARKPLARLQAS